MARRPAPFYFGTSSRERRRTAAARVRLRSAKSDPRQLSLQLFVDFYADDHGTYRPDDACTKRGTKDDR